MSHTSDDSGGFLLELYRTEKQVERSIERLTTAQTRLNKEILRRKNMLLSLQSAIGKGISDIEAGKQTLFDLEQYYSISPELRMLVANPSKALGN